jgi:hypothetical protein
MGGIGKEIIRMDTGVNISDYIQNGKIHDFGKTHTRNIRRYAAVQRALPYVQYMARKKRRYDA